MSVAKAGADDANCGNSNKDILHQAICRLVAGGVTVVAAAANDGASASHRVPAAYNEVITVSALADMDGKPGGLGGKRCYSWGGYDKDDTFADFSNYGHDVDLIAPGKCIWSTKPGPTYGYSSGTSMAAPAVTGAVALYKASRPLATPAAGQGSAPVPGQPRLEDVDRPGLDPREAARRLATRPARHVRDRRHGNRPRSGEAGGAVAVPITLGRSATFFERVSLAVGSLPTGWTAALDNTSLLGWTATATDAPARAPEPDPGGHVPRHGERHEPGARRRPRPSNVVVENDLPTAQAAAVAIVGKAKTGTGQRPGGRQLVRRDRQDQRDRRATRSSSAKNGGAWYAVKTASSTVRSFRRSLAFNATYEARLRARDGAGNWSPWVATAPFRAALVDDRSGSVEVHRVVGEDHARRRPSATRSTARRTLHAKIGYTFTGRAISAVAPLGPGRAKVRVSHRWRLPEDRRPAPREHPSPPGLLHEDLRQQRDAQDHARDRVAAAGSSSTRSSSSSRRRSALLQRP